MKETIPLKKLVIGLIVFTYLGIGLPAEGASDGSAPTDKERDVKGTPGTVSIDVTDAYIEDVLKLLSQQAKISFVPSEDVIGKKLTLYLDQVPVEAAIKSILEANSLTLRPSPATPNLYVVAASGAPRIETMTKIFVLKYAHVNPSAGETIGSFGLSGSLIKPALASASTISQTGGAGSSGGTPGATGSPSGGGGGAPGTATGGILAIIRSLLTEHGSVVPDPRTNSVIITDIPERFPLIEDTIARIDVKPIQIHIEAEILEVSLDTLRRLGLEYGSSAGIIGHYALPIRTSFFPFAEGLLKGSSASTTRGTLSFTDGNIVFKMLATESDVKFLARPRLVTLNNEVAEIQIISEPVTSITATAQSTTGTVSEVVERNTVGTILRVTPIVNENKYITMVLEPEVSRVVQSGTFSSKLDPTRRLARTTVMVPNGGTVMVAGLISTEDTRAGRRLPILGDIPLLNLPFKRTETNRDNTEVIVFVTPRLLDENEPQPMQPTIVEDREQIPLSQTEKRYWETSHQKTIRDRAITETIENILR